jgi:hypothetical protein
MMKRLGTIPKERVLENRKRFLDIEFWKKKKKEL